MADIIKNFPARLRKMTKLFYREVPSQVAAREFIDGLTTLLFPIRGKRDLTQGEVDLRWKNLQNEFVSIIRPLCCDMEPKCEDISDKFFGEIPLVFAQLMKDASMYNKCDPAAYCTEEVILCYPGFYAIMVYRIAHVMYELNIPILPRVICEYAHSQTGIEIHPGAKIGRGFYIDHGTGVVIGETCVIGDNVKLYQGVTLGATFVDKRLEGTKRHPTIEDNVIIYAGATILGGDTVIGHDSTVGGNVWLTESLPPFSRVYHKPEIVIKGKQ